MHNLTPTSVSLIVPTYKEVENLPKLVERLKQLKNNCSDCTIELLIMDDDSGDGTEQLVELEQPWIRLIIRKENRGLSQAVVDGLKQAKHEFIVVMDADLSHPPEKIPEMIQELKEGADFVIGSRYVPGASTDVEWGMFRWLNSKVATLLAWPLTRVKDPMSGFFALHRTTFERGQYALNPIGYKIGLELLVKCDCQNAREIPIHFADRQYGESKLSFQEQLRYTQHLRRLFIYRHSFGTQMAQFAVVGTSGVFVNLLVLTLLIGFNVTVELAIALAIGVSMVSNFVLNRRFTFSHARNGSIIKQFLGFVGASSVGAAVNYAITLYLLTLIPTLLPQFAALVGILAGMFFNFAINRFFVFKDK